MVVLLPLNILMANLIQRYRGKVKMFLGKSKQLKTYQKKSILDQILWFVENYLPQKKDRAIRKELRLDTLEAVSIKRIQKLASVRSKSLTPEPTNTAVSFTFGRWALPFLKLLKQIGLAK
tara:strand:+ start:907 stop:1266 length:360 start_codon:yes stop_codon:yes gene_type:complete